ncbi:MAG TPA: MMPL family transporter, partial [Chitinophagales bacterium]
VNNPSAFLDYLNNVYQNLAVYTDSATLQNANWSDEVMREKVRGKLRTLFTPAGSVVKQSLTHDPFDLSATTLSRLQKLQADKNFTINENCIVSVDSSYLLGFVKLSANIKKDGQQTLLYNTIDSSLSVLKNDEVQINVFGAALIGEANAQRIKSDIMLTVNIASVLLLLVLAFYFRSIKVLPGFVLSGVLGGSAALFLMSFKQGTISVIALGLGSVLMGSIVDCSVHILTHLKKTGNAKLTRKHLMAPVLASSITTSVAFLGLLLIGSPALNDLAIFAALSLFFGALFAIWILPSLFEKIFAKQQAQLNFVDSLMAYPFHKNAVAVVLCLLLIFVPLFFLKKVGFTRDLNELNYMPKRFSEAQSELNNASNTLQSLMLLLVEKNNLQDALSATEKIQNELPIGAIKEGHSATDILLSNEKRKTNFAYWKTFWTAEKIAHVKTILTSEAEKLGLNLQVFMPFLAELEHPQFSEISEAELQLAQNYISIDTAKKSIVSTIVLKIDKDDKRKIKDLVNVHYPEVAVIDQSSMFEDLVIQVKKSLQKISFFLLIMIVGVLFVYFRNPESVLLSALPIFLSCATTIGLMGAFGIPFNMINIIVTIFIFGLSVDYTIFSLEELTTDYREGTEHFKTGKSAILLSALTTFIGIGVLIFAKHPALHSIAAAGMIAIFSAFVYAIIFLPFLFDIL